MHYGTDIIAGFYEHQPQAAKAWGYVGQQIEAMLAFLTILLLSPQLAIIGLWGFVERGENAVCRLAFPMGAPPPKTEPMQGLCDVATGLPVYSISLSILLVATIIWYSRIRRKYG